MRIEDLNYYKKDNRARVSAKVLWEDSDRPAKEVFFETEEDFENDLYCNPNAFLIVTAVAGMHHGEKRLNIDAEVCPSLKEGLITALGWLRHWYDWYHTDNKLIKIEAKTQKVSPYLKSIRRAATFFSGGVDALSSIRWNQKNIPAEHPLAFKDGILVYGLEIHKPEAFEYVRKNMIELSIDANLKLIPIYTNVRYLDEDWIFWENEFEGAVFASIAHVLVKRCSSVSISSTHDIAFSHPHGSHPLLDTNYSSSDLQIRHELITLSRFERTKLVAEWNKALKLMRVCNHIEEYQSNLLNCCKCEKCVRTMLALLALGALDKADAFALDDVNEKLIESMDALTDTSFPFYPGLIEKMKEIKRYDISQAIEKKIAHYYKDKKKEKFRKSLLEPIIDFDEKNLGGNLRRIKRQLSPKALMRNS